MVATGSSEVVSLRLRDDAPLRLVLRAQRDFSWSRPHSSRWLLYAMMFSLCLGLLAYVVADKASVIFMWATPRWLHQAIFSRVMNG